MSDDSTKRLLRTWIQRKLARAVKALLAKALANPRSLAWPVLRTLAPVVKLGPLVLVTRFDDVVEVLSSEQAFHVTYGPNMEDMTNGGGFFLGMNDTPRYTRDVANMRGVVRREDIYGRIAPLVARTARDIVMHSTGRLDVVAELTKIAPARVIGRYFGTPGPSESVLMDWSSDVFQFLFNNPDDDPIIRSNALKAARELRRYLDDEIRRRTEQRANDASAQLSDDVLSRCLDMRDDGIPGMTSDVIRDNLFGLIVGALPTSSKAAAFALDVLLDRPRELSGAREAARHDDDALLSAYVFEALRFRPINPGLLREVARDHRLPARGFRSRTLRKGTRVLAVTQSAMFDPRKLPASSRFRLNRPPDCYLHFGRGMHTCFGRYISQVQIPGILKPLIQCHDLRRAPDETGRLRMNGPFPAELVVEFARETS